MKKNLNYEYSENENIKIPKIKNCSVNFHNLCKSCTKFLPQERLSIKEIMQIIIDELNSFSYLENLLLNDNKNWTTNQIIQFFNESIIIQYENQEKLKKCFDNIVYFRYLLLKIIINDFSSFYNNLGNLYFYGNALDLYYFKERLYYLYPSYICNLDGIFDVTCPENY